MPLHVPGSYRFGARHTYGLALGLPQILAKSVHGSSGLSASWGKVEGTLHQSAIQIMKLKGAMQTHQLFDVASPEHALHLRMTAHVHDDGPAGSRSRGIKDDIVGLVTKVRRMHDLSGRRVRMERAGSTARFRITPTHVCWSCHPAKL